MNIKIALPEMSDKHLSSKSYDVLVNKLNKSCDNCLVSGSNVLESIDTNKERLKLWKLNLTKLHEEWRII